jgi:allantoinase
VSRCDLVLRAPRAITATGEAACSIGVTGGRIVAVDPYESSLRGQRTVELEDDVVLLPGLVDTHVHVNEPGRTQWEGFATATRAAAAGGVTTIIDMPLNSIPATVDVPALETKRKAAEGQCLVDVGFWGGAIPGNLHALRSLHDAGVFGFKCFLLDSGVPEFGCLAPAELEECLGVLNAFGGLMLVHAEDGAAIEGAPSAQGDSYRGYLASRPRAAEDLAIAHVIEAARRTRAQVHIVHLSSADAIPMIRTAQREGVRISAETCPHYLVFTAEEIADGATQYKCCPPVREAANQELLWRGLTEGVLDCVV